jgi:hypothetical protein
MQRKFYSAIKKANPNALIVSHASSDMAIPISAYADVYVDGEQFRSRNSAGKLTFKVSQSYLDAMSLDQFRAEFIGQQWGIVPFFLPEFPGNGKTDVQPTLGLAALLIVHGVPPLMVNSNVPVWINMCRQLLEFDTKDANFIPYYDSLMQGITTMPMVYVSAYEKKNGDILLVVSNLSKELKQGIVNLTGIKPNYIKEVVSMVDKEKIKLDKGKLTVRLQPLSYQLFWIKV